MKNVIFRKWLVIAFVLLTLSFVCAELNAEEVTITTYYPAPEGVYDELRATKMGIGPNYYNTSSYPIPANTSLILEQKVGIGVSNPTNPLQVQNIPNTNTDAQLFLKSTQNNIPAGIGFSNNLSNTSYIRMLSSGNSPTTQDLQINAYTNLDLSYGSNVYHLYLQGSNGNVGVGTTNPSELLEIGNSGNLEFQASSIDQTNAGDIIFRDYPGTQKARVWSNPSAGATGLYLKGKNDSNPTTPDMVIDSVGNVGIGTTSPQATLDVNGTVKFDASNLSNLPIKFGMYSVQNAYSTPGQRTVTLTYTNNSFINYSQAYPIFAGYKFRFDSPGGNSMYIVQVNTNLDTISWSKTTGTLSWNVTFDFQDESPTEGYFYDLYYSIMAIK